MLVHNHNFNIRQIAESGQCFRMNQIGENKYALIAYGHYLELEQKAEDCVELACSKEEFELIWRDYFDLSYDYESLIKDIGQGKDDFLREAAAYGQGIRILRQEFFEMMISYIISQNKNIPAIKSSIEALCYKYGKSCKHKAAEVSYYTFPEPEVLASATREELRTLGVGYRDSYILSAAKAVAEGDLRIEELRNCSYEEAKKRLLRIHGIGEKVANCICLYGLHHIDVIPVDVWVKRIFSEVYHGQFDRKVFEGRMGIVQQYMFYYIRNTKNLTS